MLLPEPLPSKRKNLVSIFYTEFVRGGMNPVVCKWFPRSDKISRGPVTPDIEILFKAA